MSETAPERYYIIDDAGGSDTDDHDFTPPFIRELNAEDGGRMVAWAAAEDLFKDSKLVGRTPLEACEFGIDALTAISKRDELMKLRSDNKEFAQARLAELSELKARIQRGEPGAVIELPAQA